MRNIRSILAYLALALTICVPPAFAQAVSGKVTTAAPTYVNGAISPLSLDLSGNLRTAGTATVSGTVAVSSLPSIPAGTNNIGDVDVLTLPSLPAGTNNIGDVDVLTLPSLPAGTNNIGDVDVLTLPAIPTGTNDIGTVRITPRALVSLGPGATNTATPLVLSATARTLYSVNLVQGAGASPETFIFYDNASACSGTIRYKAVLSATSTTNIDLSQPISFSSGITVCTASFNTGFAGAGVF